MEKLKPLCGDDKECYMGAMKEFDRIDANRDNIVDGQEIHEQVDVPRMKEMDKEEAMERLHNIRNAKDVMRFFDANGDMKITRNELYQAMEPICGDNKDCYSEALRHFDNIDANGDDLVDVEEVIEEFDGKGKEGSPERPPDKEKHHDKEPEHDDGFKEFDLNGDMVHTLDEVLEVMDEYC